jgi:Glycosyltransferase family 9 (heptosyltransferase)
MKLPQNTQWLIVTVKEPVMFHQTYDETWLLNPNRRYILNANRVSVIEQYLENVSEFNNSALYHRLTAGNDICGAKILIERTRERGLGDLLFLTGVMGYLQHISGNNVELDLMGYADRGVVLTHCPLIHNKCVKCGPVEYDSLRLYNYHWFVDSATEQDAEQDQLNVYDALYRQLGFVPDQIEARWKRPTATLVNDDYQNLDMLFRRIWDDKKMELRRIGYYVVAPFSNASLRCMNYGRWLETIQLLSTRRPVVVVGTSTLRLPDMDMSVGDFASRVAQLPAVVNAIDSTSIRVLMALISRATGVVAMDSAPLYIAQALNVPAVSLWGSHPPGARIGYDKAYMDLAIWNVDACRRAPCFAYNYFPVDKCPNGERQRVCEVLDSISAKQVMAKIDMIESNQALPFKAAPSLAVVPAP